MKNNYSNFTSADLDNIDNEISNQLGYISDLQAEYRDLTAKQYWHAADAHMKNKIIPAQNYLDSLQKQKELILESLSHEQNITLNDQVASQSTVVNSTQDIPWPTIGMAVGAIMLIVVVYKIIV